MNKFIYIDEGLVANSGHQFAVLEKNIKFFLNHRITEIVVKKSSKFRAENNNIVCKVLNSSDQSIIVRVARRLNFSFITFISVLLVETFQSIRCYQFFRKNISTDSKIFVVDPSVSILIAIVFFRKKIKKLVVLSIAPQFDFIGYKYKLKLFNFFMWFLSLFFRKSLVIFYDDFRATNVKKIHGDSYPYPYLDNKLTQDVESKSENINTIIYIPGFFFKGKNYEKMIMAYQLLGKEYVISFNIYLKFRCDKSWLNNLEWISDWVLERIILISGTPDSDQYNNLILNSDLIMLAYDYSTYSYADGGSSGVVRDALFFGKPAIVTEESWMHYFLKIYVNDKEILAVNSSVVAIKDEIKYFISNKKEIGQKYLDSGVRYRSDLESYLTSFKFNIN